MASIEDAPFARLIRSRMEEKGLGLREFCRCVAVDPSYFSKVLAGKRNPPSEEEVLERIAEVLDLEAAWVVVSAGRIPRAWSGLWREPELYERAKELLTGTSGRSPRRENGWNRRPRADYVKKDLEDELL